MTEGMAPRTLEQEMAVRQYWNTHIHDLEIASHPIGTSEFFQELDDYRFEKLAYLPSLIDFEGYQGQRVLEVGCGVGIDLFRFALGGAKVSGVDFSATAIQLAQRNFQLNNLEADLFIMDGKRLSFLSDCFDLVYANGVLQYTPRPDLMVAEIGRVLKPGGKGIFMMYNKHSWLNLLSRVLRQRLEHEDAPVFTTMTQSAFKRLLQLFKNVSIIPERFPVQTRLYHGWKAILYNRLFVPIISLLPRAIVRPIGWHLIAFVEKES
jgi:SAM-dependent methyltransferase